MQSEEKANVEYFSTRIILLPRPLTLNYEGVT